MGIALVQSTRLPSWSERGLGRGIIRTDRHFVVDPHGGGDFEQLLEALEYIRDLPDPAEIQFIPGAGGGFPVRFDRGC